MCPHPTAVTMAHLDLSWVVVALAVIALAVAIIILAARVRSLESHVGSRPTHNLAIINNGAPDGDVVEKP